MDALQTVFNTIMDVIEIIKKFFEELFAVVPKDEEEATPAE